LQSFRGSLFTGTSKQDPVGFAQVWHLPEQALSQQVLSTQLVEAQSESSVQVDPLGFLPVTHM
jgi:hypothetical protein